MNVNCIICADLFIQSSDTYTTRCGHIFHYQCLMQWLERSKSCPQCRQKANEKNITRIYFNFANLEGVPEDAATLQNKIDALTLNLRMKEKDLKETEDKFKKTCEENNNLLDKVKDSKEELVKLNSHVNVLKEQLLYNKVKAKQAEKVEEELKTMKIKIVRMEHLQKGIQGTYEDAQDVARKCIDVTTISQIMLSLKKEVDILMKKKDKLFTSWKKTEKELLSLKKEAEHHKQNNDILRHQVKEHEKCESERQKLRKKIEELLQQELNTSKKDPIFERALQESPMPQLVKPKQPDFSDQTFTIVDSPDMASRVKQIKDSDSPYIQIKSNSMGMMLHSQGLTSRSASSSSLSIFKSKRQETTAIPKSIPSHVTYDGMGGHEKNISTFSSKLQPAQSLKRAKSSSTITSSKFRKLAKPQNNKIDDFMITDIE